MKTEKAILKIAEVLDVLVGNFMPDCGGDFAEYPDASPSQKKFLGDKYDDVIYCESCEYYHQCRQMTKAQNLNTELQSLLIDEGYKLDIAYGAGFNDALNGRPSSNPYKPEEEYNLQKQYARGFFDGAV